MCELLCVVVLEEVLLASSDEIERALEISTAEDELWLDVGIGVFEELKGKEKDPEAGGTWLREEEAESEDKEEGRWVEDVDSEEKVKGSGGGGKKPEDEAVLDPGEGLDGMDVDAAEMPEDVLCHELRVLLDAVGDGNIDEVVVTVDEVCRLEDDVIEAAGLDGEDAEPGIEETTELAGTQLHPHT